jgi:geranylgeranyl pyrophosphate synthase
VTRGIAPGGPARSARSAPRGRAARFGGLDLAGYLAEQAARVDAWLERALPGADEPPERLHRAMRHLLFPGGKRLRPAFAFASAEALGEPAEVALPAAGAVELVHTYSLVHDDLPCMDDDAERRGRPAVHVAFDEASAVLAGDALLALAFERLAEAPAPPERRLAALRELAAAAGSRQLVGGQADDLAFRPGSADAERVEAVHRRKTAALFVAAVAGAAHLAGADEGRFRALRRFAERTGVAFQIADDLLDRERVEGCSLSHLLGPEGARRRAEGLLSGALRELEPLGERAERLRELARFCVRRER